MGHCCCCPTVEGGLAAILERKRLMRRLGAVVEVGL